MPASKKKPAARKKKPARRSTPHFAFPVLEQRQLDLIGLALVGLGLFFAFLVYFGWDGGRAGSQAVEGMRWLLGAGHYLVPAALACAGVIAMLRPVLPAVRPFRSGAICLFLAVTLGPVGRDDRAGRRAPGLVGRHVGEDPRRHGGGDAGLRDRHAARQRRRAPLRDLPVHRGRAADHRRVGRRGREVHVGLRVHDHARAARRGQEGAAPEAARRGRHGRSTIWRRSSSPPACGSSGRRPKRRPRSTSRRSSTRCGTSNPNRMSRSPRAARGPSWRSRRSPSSRASPRTRPRTSRASRAARRSRSRRSS